MKIVSWNVNGIRAASRKGLLEWVRQENADIYCFQETKVAEGQLPPELKEVPGYEVDYVSAHEKAGYSGVAMFYKERPKRIVKGLGLERFDKEGRVQVAEFEDFALFNVYFPNGKASDERLEYKLQFYDEFLKVAQSYRKRGGVVVCGDVNTAHRPIDLARPKENEKISGFLPAERAWIDRFISAGFVDTYRFFDPSPGVYTWWDMKSRARERNVGWRIDYFFVSVDMMPKLRSAFVRAAVVGSDHCPVGIELV